MINRRPKPERGIQTVKIYTLSAVLFACLALLVLYGVEHRIERGLINKQKEAYGIVQGLAALQEFTYTQHRANAAARQLAYASEPIDHNAARIRLELIQHSTRQTTTQLANHSVVFGGIYGDIQKLSEQLDDLRQRVLKATQGDSTLAAPAVLLNDIATTEDQLDVNARWITSHVEQRLADIRSHKHRAESWSLILSLSLAASIVAAGAVLNIALTRVFRSIETKQKETHRQNLELETVHMRSLEVQRSLDRERAMLEQILAAVPQGVFWKDREGTILGCNNSFADLMGYADPDQLIGTGQPGDNLTWNDDELAEFRQDDAKVITTGRPIIDKEEQVTLIDGTVLTLLTSKTPLHDVKGNVLGVLGTCTDITERKQLEHQVAHVQKMESVGQLAAGVAHEINTPTQFVSENMRFLADAIEKLQHVVSVQDQILSPEGPALDWSSRVAKLSALKQDLDFDFVNEEAPRAVNESLEGLDRIRDIVTAMREFSHPGEAEAQPFDLNRVVRTSATVCRNRWKYIAQIEFELDDDLPTAHGHAGELGQVLVNLIVNAADSIETRHPTQIGMDLAGRIRISTRQTNPWIEIRVEDNGTGVSDEIQNRIFDPFFTTKEIGYGTGQGLAITHNVVVTKHHGQIELTNQEDGGAVFTLRLPIQPPSTESAEAA